MRLPSKKTFWNEASAIMAAESYPNFDDPVVARRLDDAHEELRRHYLGKTFPHVFAGKEYWSSVGTYHDTNPYFGDLLVLGHFQRFDPAWHIKEALTHVDHAQNEWRETPWKTRALYLYALAQKLMSDKWTWRFVSALMHDTGKSAMEAWGEYNEVYRFVLIHIWLMYKRYTEFDGFPSCALAGDYFGYSYKGRGIGVVIAPFNFPAAIPIRMLTLMLAFGNVGILKGATTASLVTRLIYDVCEEVRGDTGIGPRGLVNFAPGSGSTLGDALLTDPRVKLFSFTGSSEVCEGIIRTHQFSKRVGANQLTVCSAETGGVNWIMLDEWDDLDWFTQQCIKANFGISGQKCSTLRVAFVPVSKVDTLCEKIASQYDRYKYGNVLKGADLGPVIDLAAMREINAKIAMLEEKDIARVVYRKTIIPSPSGQDVPPTMLRADPDAILRREQMRILLNTEIFGPVFTVVPYRNADEVFALRDCSEYGLTGSYFDSDPVRLARGMQWLPAGNAYGNRRSTGATAPEAFGGLGGSKSSYNSGLKGADEVGLYVHTRTHSAVYPKEWTGKEKRAFRREMEKHGVTVKS